MNSSFRQVLTPVTGLALIGLFSGCAVFATPIGQVIVEGANYVAWPMVSGASDERQNYYEPTVLMTNKDMIQIRYLSVGPNAEHEKVMKMISDNCKGSYIETSRKELEGWTTVEADCT